jgi:hypothetical protein
MLIFGTTQLRAGLKTLNRTLQSLEISHYNALDLCVYKVQIQCAVSVAAR